MCMKYYEIFYGGKRKKPTNSACHSLSRQKKSDRMKPRFTHSNLEGTKMVHQS